MDQNKLIVLITSLIAIVCSGISYFVVVVVKDDGLLGAKCTYQEYYDVEIELRHGDLHRLDNGQDIKCVNGAIIWEAD